MVGLLLGSALLSNLARLFDTVFTHSIRELHQQHLYQQSLTSYRGSRGTRLSEVRLLAV